MTLTALSQSLLLSLFLLLTFREKDENAKTVFKHVRLCLVIIQLNASAWRGSNLIKTSLVVSCVALRAHTLLLCVYSICMYACTCIIMCVCLCLSPNQTCVTLLGPGVQDCCTCGFRPPFTTSLIHPHTYTLIYCKINV